MKIAFLFLTINDINFPEIWENYFKDNNDKISIYCHPKYPENIKTPWLKKNIIKNLTETEWGHFTNAIINLLKAALNDKNNIKFMIVSESCLPIKSFKKFYNMLSNDHINTSYIDFIDVNKFNLEHFRKFNDKNNLIKNTDKIIKHSGWWCLSRHHVKKLLIKDISLYQNIIAGDEHILSLIYPSKNIKNFQITYANWTYIVEIIDDINNKLLNLYTLKENKNTTKYDEKIFKLRKYKSTLGKHPKTYTQLSTDDLNEIKKSTAFFYRKFSPESNIINFYKELLID